MNDAQRQVAAIQANAHKFKQPSKPVQDNTHPRVLSAIDELFIRLKGITVVGNAFKTAQEEYILKQEWILAFSEEGIKNQGMIDIGTEGIRAKARKNRGTTWFPSIGEFIDLCLGSDNKLEYAERALSLFNSGQKAGCTIGQMIHKSKYYFELKQMKAKDSDKLFIDLYLKFAADNEIKPIDAFALTEAVQLSPQQQKEADNRAQAAANQFLSRFSGLAADKPKEKAVKPVKSGLKTGKIKTNYKSQRQLEEEKQRQLNMIKGL